MDVVSPLHPLNSYTPMTEPSHVLFGMEHGHGNESGDASNKIQKLAYSPIEPSASAEVSQTKVDIEKGTTPANEEVLLEINY